MEQHCGTSVEQDGYEKIGHSTSKPSGQRTSPSEQIGPPEVEPDEDEEPPLDEELDDEEDVDPDEDELVVEHCNDPQSIKHSPKYKGLL